MQVLTPGTPFSTHIHFWMLLPVRKKTILYFCRTWTWKLDCVFLYCLSLIFFSYLLILGYVWGEKSHSVEMSETHFLNAEMHKPPAWYAYANRNLPRFPCSFLLEHFSCHIFSCCLSLTLKEQITPKSKGHISLFFSHSSIYPSRLFWMEWL